MKETLEIEIDAANYASMAQTLDEHYINLQTPFYILSDFVKKLAVAIDNAYSANAALAGRVSQLEKKLEQKRSHKNGKLRRHRKPRKR